MIHDFTYLKPGTLQEALSMLSEHKDECKIICGGQSLLIVMRQGLLVTDYLIDIKGLKELSYIAYDEEGLKIGATTTHRAIETSEMIKQKYPVLVTVEKRLASIQVRNWGTIAGNLAHGDSSGDLAPTLIALNARIKLASSSGSRIVPLEEFYTGLFETAMEKDELVVEVQIPPVRPKTAVAYKKFNLIENDQAIVGVAAAVTVENGGACKEARLVLSNAGVTPIRAKSAEMVLIGKKLAGALLVKAGEAACGDADPVSDIHASEEYRRHLIKVLTERMLKQAWGQAAHS
ncbi:MAG TPA: xanthine dehydrogenase family protein subunit M [Thermodesulfobacteriota bacterium]|nr:xanthine dehydrogenase family protein subunit M [Thermodesulfobacteriota bacterium]